MKNAGRARVNKTILLKFSYSGTTLIFILPATNLFSSAELGIFFEGPSKKGKRI